MTLEQVKKALAEGYKVRVASWSEFEYIFRIGENIYDESGNYICPDSGSYFNFLFYYYAGTDCKWVIYHKPNINIKVKEIYEAMRSQVQMYMNLRKLQTSEAGIDFYDARIKTLLPYLTELEKIS